MSSSGSVKKMKIQVLLFSMFLLSMGRSALAWSESGHHIIAMIAMKMLPVEKQQALLNTLKAHPRYDSDFACPRIEDSDEVKAWFAGRSVHWPVLARNYQEYHHPKWHHQPGTTIVLGNADLSKIQVVKSAGYGSATLRTEDLHLTQAFNLCKDILKDKSNPPSDRALALCWIGHLVAESHQPCNAGSLYGEMIFQEGDQYATKIPTKKGPSLHQIWDDRLGGNYDQVHIRQRVAKLIEKYDGVFQISSEDSLDPEDWLRQSRSFAGQYVYAPEVQRKILMANAVEGSFSPIDLSDEYMENAERIAELQACFAAVRLARIWREVLID